MQPVVIGRGRLGISLANALKCPLLPGRNTRRVPDWALCLLAIPDQALGDAADALEGEGSVFVHLSGALGLDVLNGATARGYRVGAFHPLQSFPAVRSPQAFNGTMFAIDGSDADVLLELQAIADLLGGTSRRITSEHRAKYHAGSTLVGPLLVALVAQAVDVYRQIGFTQDEALIALLPFMRGTLDNLDEQRLAGALIGPVRRGDAVIFKRHLSALGGSEHATYAQLSQRAIDLAEEAGLSPLQVRELRSVLAMDTYPDTVPHLETEPSGTVSRDRGPGL